MNNLTDKAWETLQTGKTEFTKGVHTFNGCTVTITKRQEPYGYDNSKGRHAIKSARYWGKITFPNGIETRLEEERGAEPSHVQQAFLSKKNAHSTRNWVTNTYYLIRDSPWSANTK